MNKTLTKVALRYRTIYLDVNREEINMSSEATAPVMAFVARLKENGFCVSEELLHVLNSVSADVLAEITEKAVLITMITSYGLAPCGYSDDIQCQLTMADLFR